MNGVKRRLIVNIIVYVAFMLTLFVWAAVTGQL